jgi:hypothetical protein
VRAGATALVVVCAAALAGAASGGGAAAPCAARNLGGVFRITPGSAGAGSVSYVLRLRNHSARSCFLSGIPPLRLLDRRMRALPTRVFQPRPRRVVLPAGATAAAEARFSPTVSGPTEPQDRQCEPTAYTMRVGPLPGGGTLTAQVSPPTPVCIRGRLTFRPLGLRT